jgi:hypothetical protein
MTKPQQSNARRVVGLFDVFGTELESNSGQGRQDGLACFERISGAADLVYT